MHSFTPHVIHGYYKGVDENMIEQAIRLCLKNKKASAPGIPFKLLKNRTNSLKELFIRFTNDEEILSS